MISPARMAELSRPAADQLARLIVRLRQVLHEETTAGERQQVLVIWSAMLEAYGEVLGGLAKDQEATHVMKTLDLSNMDMEDDEACKAAGEIVIDEAMETHNVKLNPLE